MREGGGRGYELDTAVVFSFTSSEWLEPASELGALVFEALSGGDGGKCAEKADDASFGVVFGECIGSMGLDSDWTRSIQEVLIV